MMLLRNKFQLELFNGLRTYKLMKVTLQIACDKLEQALIEAPSNSLPRKEKNTNKPQVSTQSIIDQRRAARKKYQNHCNPENDDIWRNIAELADIALVNDEINKIEQMSVEADAVSNRNETELFNIVKS